MWSGGSAGRIRWSAQNTNLVYVAHNLGVWRSTNCAATGSDGNNWYKTSNAKWSDVAIDPTNATTVYAVGQGWTNETTFGKTGLVVRVSGSTGSVNCVASDCTANLASYHTAYSNTNWMVSAVCLDPSQPDLVVIGTDAGVFRSTSKATWWEPTGLDASTVDLLHNPDDGAMYAATQSNGVYRSLDGGATWTSIGEELGCLSSVQLALDRENRRLFVSTSGGSIWRRQVAPVLTATATPGNSIVLGWSFGATNETGYAVQRSSDGTNWVQVWATPPDATNWTDQGLSTGTLYYYRVAATNAEDRSDFGLASTRARGANHAPITVNDAVAIPQDVSILIPVLSNDTDADGDALILTGVTPPDHGTAAIQTNQARYTPTPGWYGNDTFQYVVSDGFGGLATGTVNLTVAWVNRNPECAIVTPADQTVVKAGTDLAVTATASDADGPVSKVTFYRDGLMLGESTNAPYTCVWTNVPLGGYAITAAATDRDGGVTTSLAVRVIATGSGVPEVSRVRLTIGGYSRAEPLTNFPLLVKLGANLVGFTYGGFLSPNGWDLRVRDATDTIEYPYEIEKWDGAGESLVWVRVPVLTNNTSLWVSWGTDSVQRSYTTNGAVWVNGYAGVWHMAQPNAMDSTSNRNDLTAFGIAGASAGRLGYGLNFTTGAYLTRSNSPSLTLRNNLTIVAWVNCMVSSPVLGANDTIVRKADAGPDNYYLAISRSYSNKLTFYDCGGAGVPRRIDQGTTPVAQGVWTQIGSSWDGATMRTLINGATDKQVALAGGAYNPNDGPFQIGIGRDSREGNFRGIMDEVRIASVCRSANWVWAEYMSMASNAVLLSFAPVVVPPVPPTAPTGLNATSPTPWRMDLNWSDNATNETGYLVERSADGNAWVLFATTGQNVTNLSDSGLTPDTVYWYRVAATNTAGLSPYATVSARTLSDFEFWRRAHFTAEQLGDPLISGEDADPDCDGFTNFQEFLAGTGPTDAGSCLKCSGAPVVTSGGISLQWQSASGKVYSVSFSTNLMSDLFTNRLATGILATPPTNTYEDAVSRGGCVFYRVVCDEKPDPFFPDISAAQALQLIAARGGDSDFVVLDVRTCVEYETRHIVGAINRDYYAGDFAAQLDALDKNKAYLIHCGTGGRSGSTHDLMFTLGFHEVYDMLGGMQAFEVLPGAGAYLTP